MFARTLPQLLWGQSPSLPSWHCSALVEGLRLSPCWEGVRLPRFPTLYTEGANLVFSCKQNPEGAVARPVQSVWCLLAAVDRLGGSLKTVWWVQIASQAADACFAAFVCCCLLATANSRLTRWLRLKNCQPSCDQLFACIVSPRDAAREDSLATASGGKLKHLQTCRPLKQKDQEGAQNLPPCNQPPTRAPHLQNRACLPASSLETGSCNPEKHPKWQMLHRKLAGVVGHCVNPQTARCQLRPLMATNRPSTFSMCGDGAERAPDRQQREVPGEREHPPHHPRPPDELIVFQISGDRRIAAMAASGKGMRCRLGGRRFLHCLLRKKLTGHLPLPALTSAKG